MADIFNFAQKGIANLVQFGKRGLKLIANVDNNNFTFTANDGATLVEVRGANATVAEAFITKGQFDSQTNPITQYISTEVAFDEGTTTLFEIPGNSMVYSVSVDVASPWVSANATTAIKVGDTDDDDRLFTNNDADLTQTFQFHSTYQQIYNSNANITATVTPGSASSGVATVTVLVVTENLSVKNFGYISDAGSV